MPARASALFSRLACVRSSAPMQPHAANAVHSVSRPVAAVSPLGKAAKSRQQAGQGLDGNGPKLASRSLPTLKPISFDVRADRKLAAGAHACVVEGTRDGKRCAVKLLPVADPQSSVEVKALKILGSTHPHVVVASPAVLSSDGKFMCLPMELCEEDLLTYTDAKFGLAEAEAARLFLQVVRAMRFIHSRGVYHMDIKPENILLSRGVPKLADFGTAVLRVAGTGPVGAGASSAAASSHSSNRARCLTTQQCGTLIYACPEAVAMRAARRKAELTTPAVSSESAAARHQGTPAPASRPGSSLYKNAGRALLAAVGAIKLDPPSPSPGVSVPVSKPLVSPIATGGISRDPVSTASPGHDFAYDAEKADVWSIGVSLFVLVTGFFPWKSASPSDKRYTLWCDEYSTMGPTAKLFRHVFGRAHAQNGTALSKEFMDCVWRVLHPSAAKRLTGRQLEAHPFFRTASMVLTL